MNRQATDLQISRRAAMKILGLSTAGGALAACAPTATPEAVEGRPFAGKTSRVMMVGNPMFEHVKGLAPAFEEETGLRVIMETYGFDVLQQRLDLELSTGSGAYDVAQMVMIFIGRVTDAGWATDLTPFIEADKYDLSDFVPGTINMFRRNGGLYALPWLPDAMGSVYRRDLFEAAGIDEFPTTFEGLLEIAPKIHSDDVVFITGENNFHWLWPPYLQGYGGNFFADPPEDLTPTFNTPEAVESAKIFTELFSKYSFPDATSVGLSEAATALSQGQAAVGISGLGILSQVLNPETSVVLDRMSFAPVPEGPAGWFPQLAMHGYMIPAGATQKEVAWETIKWLVSPEVTRQFATELGVFAQNRFSILNDPEIQERFKLEAGPHPLDVMADSMDRAGAGYMAYRTVPPFRAVGSEVIIAIGEMLSGQKEVETALNDLQDRAINVLREAGYL